MDFTDGTVIVCGLAILGSLLAAHVCYRQDATETAEADLDTIRKEVNTMFETSTPLTTEETRLATLLTMAAAPIYAELMAASTDLDDGNIKPQDAMSKAALAVIHAKLLVGAVRAELSMQYTPPHEKEKT